MSTSPSSSSSPPGAETPDELARRYLHAHQDGDLSELYRLFDLTAHGARPASDFETAFKQLTAIPLREVEYVAGPLPDPVLGGEVIYYLPDGKIDKMIGAVCGKLLLHAEDGRTIDPGFAVITPLGPDGAVDSDVGNRFYIAELRPVFFDAIKAATTGSEPRYTAASLEPVPDSRKGEGARRFK